jgi:hypothetical protein
VDEGEEVEGEVSSGIDDDPIHVGPTREVWLESGYGAEVSDDGDGRPEDPVLI